MDVMSITTRIADALPIRLTRRLHLTVQVRHRHLSPTVGEVRAQLALTWARMVEVPVQDETGEECWVYERQDVRIPLFRLPGRKLVELWDHSKERWLTGPVAE